MIINKDIIENIKYKIDSSINVENKNLCYFLLLSYMTHFSELRNPPVWIRELIESTSNPYLRNTDCDDISLKIKREIFNIYVDNVVIYLNNYIEDPIINEILENFKNVRYD